ncbi:hypothetical protein PHYBOEH_008709 [Phytophthora boehmeriae]|uniref:GAF domain-containing protein n=1 Tax=Phytophthora boehmeriae TaxID=109152 RepID=A0A8T1W2M1_9STRA|nr:hypothetical protein PHYBOEH_008709 [Phytophthora boehmeriae]
MSSAPTISTLPSEDDLHDEMARSFMPSTDAEMLERARAGHTSENFAAMAAGPELGGPHGPWKRVETAGRFAVFRREIPRSNNDKRPPRVEVMCAGRLEASLEEIASILHSSSESEHNTVMEGLYAKGFIFGSFEREVPCPEVPGSKQDEQPGDGSGEQLAVRTKSFARTTLFAHNEQWCYSDYFQRKKERDGFTMSKRALHPFEPTPGRIEGRNSRVDQLHGLNASYLVEKFPDQKGLRVVFHAWFEDQEDLTEDSRRSSRSTSTRSGSTSGRSGSTSSRSGSLRRSSSSRSSLGSRRLRNHKDSKAQARRLLTLAHAITRLPEVVSRRRFGVQVPIDENSSFAPNSRCPCCTHSLAPVKLTIAMAASAISKRSMVPLKMDTRRCYLCGYLVCIDCWKQEHMESSTGRVAAIIVCNRCYSNVHACEYSEVFAGTAAERETHRGTARVVADTNDTSTVSLLIDFLSTSLLSATAGSPEHGAVVRVIQTLLRQEEESELDEDEDETDEEESDDDEDNNELQLPSPRCGIMDDTATLTKVADLLGDEQRMPALEACPLANANQRDYQLDLPEDPTTDVPGSPIPSNEVARLEAIKNNGLMLLADRLAPETPAEDIAELERNAPNVQDLELLCHLVVKTLGCGDAFVTLMASKTEHIIAATHPGFLHAAVPRDQTTCQHTIMSPHPFMVAHHEADVRFHKQGPTSGVPIRFYVGFPLHVQGSGGEQVAIGTLCCIDTKPRNEITRTQYATIRRLSSTARHFLLQKGHQLQHEQKLALEGGDGHRN